LFSLLKPEIASVSWKRGNTPSIIETVRSGQQRRIAIGAGDDCSLNIFSLPASGVDRMAGFYHRVDLLADDFQSDGCGAV
jgi:hypothetical protein